MKAALFPRPLYTNKTPRCAEKAQGECGSFAVGASIRQRLSDSDRPMLRAQRIRRKLGSDDGTDEPEKPNGMHWVTYNRLLDQADELDDRGWMSALGGLLSRVS